MMVPLLVKTASVPAGLVCVESGVCKEARDKQMLVPLLARCKNGTHRQPLLQPNVCKLLVYSTGATYTAQGTAATQADA
jgi:hypothetical protein